MNELNRGEVKSVSPVNISHVLSPHGGLLLLREVSVQHQYAPKVRRTNMVPAPTPVSSPQSIPSTTGAPSVASLAAVGCMPTCVAYTNVNDSMRAYCGFFMPCVCGLPVYFLTSVASSPWRPMDFTLSQPCRTAGWTFWFWTCASMLAVPCAKAP